MLAPFLETEKERVERWRLQVLIEAGYPLRVAERVAFSTVDLHLAVALVEQGCAPKLAAEILL